MSPRNIHILLEIYTFVCLKDAVYLAHDAMVSKYAGVHELLKLGLIEETANDYRNLRIEDEIPWDTTEKGDVWIETICETPMPKPTWKVQYE